MKKVFRKVSVVAIALVFAFSSCMSHSHMVGDGAKNGQEVEKRQWYALWGLVPLNNVDTKQMAGGATDYTIESETGVLDVVLNIFTGIATINSRSVIVTK